MKGLLINLVDSQQVSLSLYFWKLICCVFMYFRLTFHVHMYIFLNSLLLLCKLSLLRNSPNVDEALTKYFHILEGEVRQFFSLALSYNWNLTKGKVQKKKERKKLTSVSFMFVCVAENGEMLVFISFFFPKIV